MNCILNFQEINNQKWFMLFACLSLCKRTIHTSQTINASLSCMTWVRKMMISLSNVNDDAMFFVSISFLLHTNCLVSVWSTLRYVHKNRCVCLCMRWVRLPWSSSSSAPSCFCIRWREYKQIYRREWEWAKFPTYSHIRSIELVSYMRLYEHAQFSSRIKCTHWLRW